MVKNNVEIKAYIDNNFMEGICVNEVVSVLEKMSCDDYLRFKYDIKFVCGNCMLQYVGRMEDVYKYLNCVAEILKIKISEGGIEV